MSFKEAYEEFLIYAIKRHKKQGFITLESKLNNWVYPYFKDYQLKDITKKDIIDWQNELYSQDFKNSYLESIYIHFGQLFDFFVNSSYLPLNLVKEVGPFKKKFEEPNFDFYTYDEFLRFISSLDHIVYKTFFEFLFFTGVRPGEALALKFSDIQGSYICITKNMTNKGGRSLDTPKNQSSFRKILIDKSLLKKLNLLHKYYVGNLGSSSNDYFLFGGFKPLSVTTINRYKFRACDKSNIRPITLHQFRHSHASLLLQKGIMVNEVSRRLGHSKTSTTLDIYCHTDLSQEKRVVSTLNSLRFNFFTTLENKLKNIIFIFKPKLK